MMIEERKKKPAEENCDKTRENVRELFQKSKVNHKLLDENREVQLYNNMLHLKVIHLNEFPKKDSETSERKVFKSLKSGTTVTVNSLIVGHFQT